MFRSKPLAVRRTWMFDRESFGDHNISPKQRKMANGFSQQYVKRKQKYSFQMQRLDADYEPHAIVRLIYRASDEADQRKKKSIIRVTALKPLWKKHKTPCSAWQVSQLKIKIQAVEAGKHGRLKACQWFLAHPNRCSRGWEKHKNPLILLVKPGFSLGTIHSRAKQHLQA